MSPPDIMLEENYQKPLHNLPLEFNYEKPAESRYFFNPVFGGLFKFNELKGTPGCEFSGCLEVFYCHVNDMALDGMSAVALDYDDPYEGAKEALNAGFDIEHEKLIGRYTFKDFVFQDDDGQRKVGKQIKGAFIHPDFKQYKIATLLYKYLTKREFGLSRI
ncbi:hypothetical protein ABSDF3409 [Acinetobacter baumannii SDF]|uniref:Uncharacterized protein n=1 Tax=Acinetobacter baumannii (strain SDF) TaxID=509170 RepID=B0VN91_ACIBS|nr:hypothetical protein ABSDF3409 [Acinetobacter baumannii SDF]